MNQFRVVSRLISKVDKIKLMKAYCFNCHKDAKFSLRIVQSNETVLIGAGEAYKPACRECHIYFSEQREKGNLNINKDNLLDKENKGEKNKSEETILKTNDLQLKDEKHFSSDNNLPSPNSQPNIS